MLNIPQRRKSEGTVEGRLLIQILKFRITRDHVAGVRHTPRRKSEAPVEDRLLVKVIKFRKTMDRAAFVGHTTKKKNSSLAKKYIIELYIIL